MQEAACNVIQIVTLTGMAPAAMSVSGQDVGLTHFIS